MSTEISIKDQAAEIVKTYSSNKQLATAKWKALNEQVKALPKIETPEQQEKAKGLIEEAKQVYKQLYEARIPETKKLDEIKSKFIAMEKAFTDISATMQARVNDYAAEVRKQQLEAERKANEARAALESKRVARDKEIAEIRQYVDNICKQQIRKFTELNTPDEVLAFTLSQIDILPLLKKSGDTLTEADKVDLMSYAGKAYIELSASTVKIAKGRADLMEKDADKAREKMEERAKAMELELQAKAVEMAGESSLRDLKESIEVEGALEVALPDVKVKTALKATVVDKRGWLQVMAKWWELEGSSWDADKIEKKLSFMLTAVNKAANKDGELIDSKFVTYEEEVKG